MSRRKIPAWQREAERRAKLFLDREMDQARITRACQQRVIGAVIALMSAPPQGRSLEHSLAWGQALLRDVQGEPLAGRWYVRQYQRSGTAENT